MVNAKRIFFIIVSNVYEAFDFSASGFIQLLIRKVHLAPRVFLQTKRLGPRINPDITHFARNALECGDLTPAFRSQLSTAPVIEFRLRRPRRFTRVF